MSGVAAGFLVASLITGQLQAPSTPRVWGYVFLMSSVCTIVAFCTLLAGLRRVGPVRTGIIATVEPFFTAPFGMALLGEQLTGGTLIGGALIATAVILLQWHSGRSRESETV